MKSYARGTPEQWQALVADQKASQLSAPDYCKQHDIAYASFSKWRTKLKLADEKDEQNKPTPFVELTGVDKEINHKPHWHIELDIAPGVQLRIAR